MDKELEQQAIETFAAVPEIYQQAFRDAGADFPDELVAEIKKDPNQAINLVNSDKNLKSAVINVFKSNKDAILKYMQQATSMFKQGGKFDYLNKLQQGGQLSRRQAFEESQKNRGFNRSQARTAYRNARNAGLDKQAALAAIIGQPQETEVVERPTLINNVTAPSVRLTTQSETISTRPTTNYNNVDFGVFNFNEAFGRARKAGLNEFTWNGKRYTTELAPNTTVESEPEQQPSLIVRKLQEAVAPIVEDQRWINEHRPYWADLKRQGGKLEQENNIRKKYIKDSKEAAEESSEKMKKISKDYDKKLDKVQKGQEGLNLNINGKTSMLKRKDYVNNVNDLNRLLNNSYSQNNASQASSEGIKNRLTKTYNRVNNALDFLLGPSKQEFTDYRNNHPELGYFQAMSKLDRERHNRLIINGDKKY